MNGAACQSDLYIKIYTIPNATINVIQIVYPLTPKLQKLILDHFCVCNEGYVWNMVKRKPDERVGLVHLLQTYAFAEIV